MLERRPTVCRVCHAQCALLVDYADGRPVSAHGDPENPAYHGYSCIKGRQIAVHPSLPSRLTHSRKRQPDGSQVPLASAAATDEIAERLRAIVAEHGPRSVALYVGTFGYNNFAAQAFARAFMDALGSPMVFTSVTIDQPGKAVAAALHGAWLAGVPTPEEWDALLLVGTNPLVSMNGGLGMNPARQLHRARKRGMLLVVIDPRETECARQADIFLQPRPGADAALLAGFARLWIEEGFLDRAFVDAHATGLTALAEAVAPFTPQMAAARADVPVDRFLDAARALGRARRGAISAGTGPNMSGQGNLVEYLVRSLTTLRGWWLRAGELKHNPGVLVEPLPAIAASPGPTPAWGFGESLRVRGLGESAAGLPTAALADEILLPGPGRIRALLVLGGNPMLAWPDQFKTHDAMRALDLLVCFDPRLSATARLAHYTIAPKVFAETEGNTALNELLGNFGPGWGYDLPYAQVTPPLQSPPVGADVVEEWEAFYAMAQALQLQLVIKPFSVLDPARAMALASRVDMRSKPSESEVWSMVLAGAPIPYAKVRSHPRGHVFDRPPVVVAPQPADWAGRLEVGAAPMMQALANAAVASPPPDPRYPFRVISRRLHDAHNSNWREDPVLARRRPHNPAFLHPEDLVELGVADGEVIELESARARIRCVAEAAADVRRGCISIAHGWGGNPGEDDDPRREGGNTGRLGFTDRDFDPITGIPVMSGIAVQVWPVVDQRAHRV